MSRVVSTSSAGVSNGDVLTDFDGGGAAAGDQLLFVGYGTAAQGANVTVVNATTWSINSFNGAIHDLVNVTNAAALHPSDYTFI